MTFLRILLPVLFSGIIILPDARAAEIQFRFVLTDAEAFSESFHNYLYNFDNSGRDRTVTVSDKVFLSRPDVEAIEAGLAAGSKTHVSFINFVLTKDAAKKLEGLREKFPKKELAIMVDDTVFKILYLPYGKNGKILVNARQIATVDDARRFADEIGIKLRMSIR